MTILGVVAGLVAWWLQAAPGPQGVAATASQRDEIDGPPERVQPTVALPERGIAARLPPRRAGEIDLCGYGRVNGEWIQFPADVERPAMASFARWADRETNSTNEVERARGLFFRTRLTFTEVREATASRLSGHAANAYTICDAQCNKEASRAAYEATRADRDAIARMATATRNPDVYALALMTCGSRENLRSGPCAQLSHEQWAQIDPANAAPWLFVAAEAQMRKETAARDEALERVARSQHVNLRSKPVLEGVVAMADAPGSESASVIGLTVGAGILAALVMPSGAVSEACTVDAVRDPNFRALCDALARLLVERGSTAVDFSVGRAVGERVGWPALAIAALRTEAQAIEAVTSGDLGRHSPYSCGWSRALRELILARAQLGELEAGRARIRAAQRSVDELASEWEATIKAERARIEALMAAPAVLDKAAKTSDTRAVAPPAR